MFIAPPDMTPSASSLTNQLSIFGHLMVDISMVERIFPLFENHQKFVKKFVEVSRKSF